MSKQMKLKCCLLLAALNQSITDAVFFHWLKLKVAFSRHFIVDVVEDLFADFAYFGLVFKSVS